jgi:hypothetical protein
VTFGNLGKNKTYFLQWMFKSAENGGICSCAEQENMQREMEGS